LGIVACGGVISDCRRALGYAKWCEDTGCFDHVVSGIGQTRLYFFVFIWRLAICIASDEMTASDEYRVRAAKLRADAERQEDPLFRGMFETLAKSYSRLARHHERDASRLAYKLSPPIAEGPLTRRLHDLELNRRDE